MENKKPKTSTGFHGNQYVDSQGRPRNPASTKGGPKKNSTKHK